MLRKLLVDKPTLRVWLRGCAGVLVILVISAAAFMVISLTGLESGGKEVLVPEVVGELQAEAEHRLTEAGLQAHVSGHHYHSEIPRGHVISSSPRALSRVRTGRQVSLVVSSGKRKISVPKVVGLGLADAERILREIALVVGRVSRRHSEAQVNQVMNQKPAAGSRLARGEKVNLVVSGGPNFGQLLGPDGEVLLRRIRIVVPVGPIVQGVRVTLEHDRMVKTIYDRIHRPGDEITVDFTGTSGDRVEVYIEDQRIERIRL